MLNSFRARSSCEEEAKFIQDRISSVEKNIGELCHVFGQYTRKVARVRDKGDEIARVSLGFAAGETINKSLANGLENFADSISILSDYGDIRTQRIDSKVVGEFSKYEDICKVAKDEVKDIFAARDKEVSRKRQLDRIRDRNPRNRQQIVQAETELVKATAEVSKTVHHIEDKSNAFEKQKLHDIKSILLDFISTEMGYHAKALEVLTKAYQDIHGIDEASDLEEFKKSLRSSETLQKHRSASRTSLFRSNNSLNSLGMLFSTSHNVKAPGIPSSYSKDRMKTTKSEETLDSMKHGGTESDEDTYTDQETSENNETSENDSPPPVVVIKGNRKL